MKGTSLPPCPTCSRAPTTRPGLPCNLCDWEASESEERVKEEQAYDALMLGLMDRMAHIPDHVEQLTTPEGKVLGKMLSEGFTILFDTIINTTDPITRGHLTQAFKKS